MIWVFIVSGTLATLYIIWIGFLFHGWLTLPVYRPKRDSVCFTTVVVPVRNEEGNLSKLLESLVRQDYPLKYFEILVVDDHSVDKTANIAEKYIGLYPNIRLIKLTGDHKGKKAAISEGVFRARHDLIVTTDADCTMGKSWLGELVSYYSEHRPSVIAGPIFLKGGQGFAGFFQKLEFISLVAASAGAINIKKPLMCNGANLAFRKKDYKKVSPNLKMHLASGDDVFFLHAVKKLNNSGIHFIKSPAAIVYTPAVNTLKGFLNQRRRWTAKSKNYSQISPVFTSLLILSVNVLLLGLLFAGFFRFEYHLKK